MNACERLHSETNYVGSSPSVGIFLCNYNSWMRASNKLMKNTKFVGVPVTEYLFM